MLDGMNQHRLLKIGLLVRQYQRHLFKQFVKAQGLSLAVAILIRLKPLKKRQISYQLLALSPDELLHHSDIDIIINLTTPQHHYPLNKQILEAGKSVYCEKPLALRAEEALELVALAEQRGFYLGGAPDTFLGAGLQTVRAILDEGLIGTPLGASGFMMSAGHERWHPNPSFFYEVGGGPLFDMGPYYLTALVFLLGPVKRLSARAQLSFAERTITSQPLAGQKIKVETPTHITSLLEFHEGLHASLTTSFDVQGSKCSNIEIYGSEASITVPDPNTFGGVIQLKARGQSEWQELPLRYAYSQNSRGIGVADMARAMAEGQANHRANGQMAAHVVEIMESVLKASASHSWLDLKSNCKRPPALALGLSESEWFKLS
ncbi:MAG: Gfo/Idh/MocA family oxidoreductase [Deinococcales bacterium]